MSADKEPTGIDAHVGKRIRIRRTSLRVSQEKLGEHLGVSFQQIQKYEKGSNRIGAGQLFQIAKLLKVEPNYFYEGLGAGRPESGFAEGQSRIGVNVEDTVEGIALHKAFARIRSQKVRRRIVDLVAAVADSTPT